MSLPSVYLLLNHNPNAQPSVRPTEPLSDFRKTVMGDGTRGDYASLILAGGLVAFLTWMIDRPDALIWSFRIGGAVTAALGVFLFLKACVLKDVESDYLRLIQKHYFRRDGFCFTSVVTAEEGVAVMKVYFQSQYDQPSVARVALRPSRRLFLARPAIFPIIFEIDCPPAGVGVARIAFSIPHDLQGQLQSFEVGLSVQYPHGKGQRVRFHEGLLLRTNANFGDSFSTGLTIIAACVGILTLSRLATAKIKLPVGVAGELSVPSEPEVIVLWQLGDRDLRNIPA